VFEERGVGVGEFGSYHAVVAGGSLVKAGPLR
jgi:hypothetical protein